MGRKAYLKFLLAGLFLCSPCLASLRPDTLQLADHLKRFRGHKIHELQAGEFTSIQSEYLAWIDSRVHDGVDANVLNEELSAAGLLSEGPQTIDDQFDRTYAGYLVDVEFDSVDGADDLTLIKASIYTGGSCNVDETAALYQRRPWLRIAWINAERSYTHGYHLVQIAAGPSQTGRRLLASAWVASNCSSTWNGSKFRIDRLGERSLQSLFNRNAGFKNDEDVGIEVKADLVTFRYTTSSGDSDVLVRKGIANYRIDGLRAVRVAPLALSSGGLVSEWLSMNDTEAARWSSPSAAAWHRQRSKTFTKGLFAWEYVADCSGPPMSREIGIRSNDTGQLAYLRIGGVFATQFKILAVTEKPSASCIQLDIRSDFSKLFSELR
jgi:hypothetical protein